MRRRIEERSDHDEPIGGDSLVDRTHLGKGLGGRATRGALVTLSGQWARVSLQIGSLAVLARLLTPADYGLFAMVTAITAGAAQLRDMGLSTATMQREDLTYAQVNSLFWLSVCIGVAMSIAVAAGSPVVAAFYDRPAVQSMTAAMAVIFSLAGLASQHQALLNRQMRYGTVATIELIALAIASVVAVAVAYNGGGYWALVSREVVLAVVRVPMFWWSSPWRPGRPARAEGVGRLVSFGASLSAFQLLNYLSRNVDNALLGRYSTAAQLGLYTRAYQLLLMPIRQINSPLDRIAIPTLSVLIDQQARYRRYYATSVSVLAFLALPLFVLMAALSEELVLIVLGDQWMDAAVIFRILVIAGLAQTLEYSSGWLYASTGRTGRQAMWGLISRPLLVLSFVVGLPWGAQGVATAYAAASCTILPFGLAYAMRDAPVTGRDFIEASWRPFISCIVLYAVAAATAEATTAGPLVRAILGTVAGGAAFLAVIAAWPSARAQMTQLIRTLRESVRSKTAA